MADETPQRKPINFTVVPDESSESPAATYCNYAECRSTPFDVSLIFCVVKPFSPQERRGAEENVKVPAPIVGRVVMSVPFAFNLVAMLEEQLRAFRKSDPNVGVTDGTVLH